VYLTNLKKSICENKKKFFAQRLQPNRYRTLIHTDMQRPLPKTASRPD
jgi:hypothetical protein